MALVLAIENESRLPDGGPLSYKLSGRRGIDIGRDSHLDWTLPDPSRFISGKHCEIRYREGSYWLHDVSSNGTFVNGSDKRMQGPHRLRNGDRLEIGQYVISVAIDGDEAQASGDESAARAHESGELWGVTDEAAPPIHPGHLRPPARNGPPQPDFLDWAVDVPDAQSGFSAPPPAPVPRQRPRGVDAGADWTVERPLAPAQPMQPMASVPRPRRPATAAPELDYAAAVPIRQPAPYPAQLPAWDVDEPAPQPAEPVEMVDAEPEVRAPAVPVAEPPPAAPPATDLLQRFARGAGIPEDFFAQLDAGDVAEELGFLMRVVAANLKQLLAARAESRGLMRSSNQTMVQALDNNPLKFSPTPEDALRIMFGPRTKSYLDARRTLQQSFDDIKAHQIDTYSAMQHALQMLLEELDPQTIEGATPAEGRLGAVVGSRKAKLWDAYVARWDAKASRSGSGLIDRFMLHFSECYQRNSRNSR